MNIHTLWGIAEQGPMVVGFPLTFSPRFSGLATGLKKLLSEARIEVYLIFVRGSLPLHRLWLGYEHT
jgi:hypothetical protein